MGFLEAWKEGQVSSVTQLNLRYVVKALIITKAPYSSSCGNIRIRYSGESQHIYREAELILHQHQGPNRDSLSGLRIPPPKKKCEPPKAITTNPFLLNREFLLPKSPAKALPEEGTSFDDVISISNSLMLTLSWMCHFWTFMKAIKRHKYINILNLYESGCIEF